MPNVPTPNEILSNILSDLEAGYARIGSTASVSPGSEPYLRSEAFANALGVAYATLAVAQENLFLDSATGENLDRVLGSYGLTRKPATKAIGSVVLSAVSPVLIPTQSQLGSVLGGELFEVISGGVFSPGQTIDLQAVNPGPGGNLVPGSLFKWTSPETGVAPTAMSSLGTSGGSPTETDEDARQRLKAILSDPPGYGNASQIARDVESYDPIVQKAFVYPAANGPATVHVAVIQAPSATSQTRAIPAPKLAQIRNATLANAAEYVEVVVTSVVEEIVDLALGLNIPYPAGSLTYGIGGGWINQNPYPLPMTGSMFCPLMLGTTPTTIRFQAKNGTQPIDKLTQLSWIDGTFTVRTATVLAHSITGGGTTHECQLSSPFSGSAAGDFIFPSAVKAQDYVDSILAHFAKMGPGEKTNAPGVLPRAYRKPVPYSQFPSNIDDNLLKTFTSRNAEVLDAEFKYRSSNVPSLPASISNGPSIFVPRRIAFYPKGL